MRGSFVSIGFAFVLSVYLSSLGCTSSLNYTATAPSSSALSEIAHAANVDEVSLKTHVNALVSRGGLVALSSVESPEDFPVLACVADTMHDGTLNLSDLVLVAGQIDKSCAQIAQEVAEDSETDNDINCVNLDRDEHHQVNLDDVAVFALLLQEHPEFSTDLCHNPEAGDGDQLAPYTEAIAWVNTNPLDAETFGSSDYEYYLSLIGGGEESEVRIDSVSSLSLEHGQSYTIQGEGFGVKYPVEPWLYDDFENGSIGQIISGEHWCVGSSYGGITPEYSNDVTRGQNQVVSKQGPFGNTTLEACGYPYGSLGGEFYATGWFRGEDEGGSRSFKFIQANDGNWGNPRFNSGGDCSGWYRSSAVGCTGNYAIPPQGLGGSVFTDQWDRWEWHADMGSLARWRTWSNQELKLDMYGNVFDNSSCSNIESVYFSSYYGIGGDCPEDAHGWWYWDEVYVDNTQARVEVCDRAMKSQATHCEIQIPHTTWNGSSIHFRVNKGSFSEGATVYLFVIESAGTASNGFPVSLR